MAIVWAAVAISPKEFIIDAKATYPREVPKRCKALGSATRRQGFNTSQSGRSFCPLGDSSGCRQSTTVMHTPPIMKEMALATAAPMTPHPAPKTVMPHTCRVG